MKLHLEFDPDHDDIACVNAILAAVHGKAAPVAATVQDKPAVAAAEPEETPAAPTAEPAVTLEQARAAMAAYAKTHGRGKAKQVLSDHGVDKLTNADATTLAEIYKMIANG